MVECGCPKSSHRPYPPHRPGEFCDGDPVERPGNHRGADIEITGDEAGAGGQGDFGRGRVGGELRSVAQAVGGIENLIDEKAKDQDTVMLIKYLAGEEREEKILENPQILKTPVVRNGKQATVGVKPEVWKNWE